jgi:biopolymer transport protein ExbB
MHNMTELLQAVHVGGAWVYPILALALIAMVLIIDKLYVYWRYGRLADDLMDLVETYNFDWKAFEERLVRLRAGHYYGRFFQVIAANRLKPAWWVESRAADEASLIEKAFGRGLWALETIVTAAPLLGLLGTISGMIGAFRLFGAEGLVNPGAVTGGVAEALIATAFGIFVALVALFGFNFLSRLQAQVMDQMERLGTRVIDRIRLDQQERAGEAA